MLVKRVEFLLLLLLAYHITSVKPDAIEEALLSTLFKNYDSRARPSTCHTRPTTIFPSLIINQIIDLDERNQILSTYSLLLLRWYDLRLTWNASNFDNLGVITISAENVWRPDIVLFNGAEKFDFQSSNQYVKITSLGEIAWIPYGEFKTQCTVDVKYFPFDVQNCTISISSATFFIDQIDFVVRDELILNYYLPNAEWMLTDNSHSKIIITEPFPVAVVSFHLILERKPLFFVFNLILPCVIILAVAFLSFLVPIQSGEKMSIGITTLLSIVVLLLVIADQLPPTSDSIPLISLFYAASTLIIAFICLMSVLTLNIHHYGEQGKFPRVLDLNTIRSKDMGKEANIKEISDSSKSSGSYNEQFNRNCRFCCTLLFKKKRVSPTNVNGEDESVDIAEKDMVQLQWTLLADIIDRFLFYILLTATIFILLGIIGQAPNANLF